MTTTKLDLDTVTAADIPALVARVRELEAATQQSVCVYCGHMSPRDNAEMLDHIRSCPKRDDALSADLRAHVAKLAEIRKALEPVLDAVVAFGKAKGDDAEASSVLAIVDAVLAMVAKLDPSG